MAQLGRDYAERLGPTYEPKVASSLDAEANRLEETIRARDEAIARRKGAHAAAQPLVRKGVRCIDMLDTHFRHVLTPATAAEWNQAKTFERSHLAKRRAVAAEPDRALEQPGPAAALPGPAKALPAPKVLELPAAPILGRIAMLFSGSRKRRDEAEQKVDADFTVDETRRLSNGEKTPEA